MRLLGAVRQAEGDFAGAIAIWQQIKDSNSILQAAAQAEADGNLEDALIAYQAAWELDPESVTLVLANLLGNNIRDADAAEGVLRQSLAAFPNSRYWANWSLRLGDLLRDQQSWDEAITAYESAIAQAPDLWAAYIGLGWARYERGDGLQAAINEFQIAIDISQSRGHGHFSVAGVLTREKRFEEADKWFAAAIALNPEVQWWFLARGNAARQDGNIQRALSVYQEALKRFPNFAPAYYEMAFTYRMNEQPAFAIAAIERALELMAPPNANYYVRAGSIYEWTGDEKKALDAFYHAVALDSENTLAQEGIKRLEEDH